MPTGSLEEEQQSLGRQGDLEARQAQARADGIQRQAEFEAEQLRDQQSREMKRRADLDMREAALEAERKGIANTSIDQNQWWGSRSDSQKGVAYIGAFLGGGLSVFNGGKNDFTDFMQQQIGQNLEVQKANLANRKDALEMGQNMYGRLLQRYGDERVADNMFLAASYDALGHQAGAQAAQFDSPIVREKGQQMQIMAARQAKVATAAAAAAQQKLDMDRKEMAIKQMDAGTRRYEAGTGRMRAGTDARQQAWGERKDVADLAFRYEDMGMKHEDAMAKARDEVAKGKVEQEKWEAEKRGREVFMPNGKPLVDQRTGQPYMAGNAELADKHRTQLNNTWAFRRQLTQYLDLMDHAGNEFSGIPGVSATDARAKADQLHADMMLKVKNSYDTGALDKGMVDVFNTYVAPPKEWLGKSNPTASARQGLDSWRENTNNTYRMEYGYSGNFVDDWDSQVQPDQKKAPSDPWLTEHRAKEEGATRRSYQGNSEAAYPSGPPKPMGMMPEEQQRPEELSRPRPEGPPAAAPPAPQQKYAAPSVDPSTQDETDSRIDFVEKHLGAQQVTLRTGHGEAQVPLSSLSRKNAMAATDGSFISIHDQPQGLPKGVKQMDWDDAALHNIEQAESLWQKQRDAQTKTIGRK